MLIRGIKCLRKLGGHVVERARASVNRGIDGVVGRPSALPWNRSIPLLTCSISCFVDSSTVHRLLEHTARRRQRIGRGAQNARKRRCTGLNVLQVLDRIAECRRQVGDKVTHLVGAHVIEQAGHGLEPDGRNGFGKGLVNLTLNSARAFLGHDLCDGVGLLILVELDIGMLHVRSRRASSCRR